jgi:hypothetical protein
MELNWKDKNLETKIKKKHELSFHRANQSLNLV